jgi:hypothetical protein
MTHKHSNRERAVMAACTAAAIGMVAAAAHAAALGDGIYCRGVRFCRARVLVPSLVWCLAMTS